MHAFCLCNLPIELLAPFRGLCLCPAKSRFPTAETGVGSTTLTKEMFLSHLYGGMDEPEMKIIDVFICKLRKKLASASGGKDYIETVWGRGYVMRELPENAASVSV